MSKERYNMWKLGKNELFAEGRIWILFRYFIDGRIRIHYFLESRIRSWIRFFIVVRIQIRVTANRIRNPDYMYVFL